MCEKELGGPDKGHEKSLCLAGLGVEIRTQDLSIMDQVYQSFKRLAPS